MSYANGTTHYNLPQTVGTDKRDWFDTNQAFLDLDADLYSAKQTADTTSEGLASTNTALGNLTTRVTTAEGDIDTLESNLNTTNENVGVNATAIARLNTTVSDNKQDLEDMITAYEEETATATQLHNVGDYFRYNNVLYITTVTIRIGDTIVPDVNCSSTNVMTRVYNLEHSGGGSVSADTVSFDNTGTNLSSTNVEDVVKEVNNKIPSTPTVGATRYNTTSNKMEYYNGSQWIEISIGGGEMVALDYSNPLYTFNTSNTSYTATGECYISGALYGIVSNPLTINGTDVAIPSISGSTHGVVYIPPIKLTNGDVVTASGQGSNARLHIFTPKS